MKKEKNKTKKNKVEIVVDGKKVLKVKVPEKALDQLLWYVSAQMEECPHGRDWEKCPDCTEGIFE